MRIALWIALGMVGAGVETAAAGSTCGSSGDGGSSSDSSSDSSSSSSDSDSYSYDDSSSSTSSTPPRPACIETTDVHGHRECTKFGTWGKPYRAPGFHIELGTAVRRFANPLGERTGALQHGTDSFVYRVVGDGATAGGAVALDTAMVVQLRLGMALRHGFYVAAEAEVGAVNNPSSSSTAEMLSTGELGTPDIKLRGVAIGSGVAIAGIRGRAGNTSFGVEAAGGYRALSYTYDSHYLACETTMSITETVPILEGRARAAHWFSPNASIGASLGKSVIDEAWVGGFYVGGHTSAFDGQ
jgi:hypothetical protein